MNNPFVQFKTFEVYKKDASLLATDLKRIESINQNKHTDVSENVLFGMRAIATNQIVLNNPQSILKLTEKVQEYGWQNLERMMRDVALDCEQPDFVKEPCLKRIDSVLNFVDSSNLSDEHKNDVSRELEFYKNQQKVLSMFQSTFANDFDKSVLTLNRAEMMTNRKMMENVVVKTTPVNHMSSFIPEINFKQYEVYQSEAIWAAIGIGLLYVFNYGYKTSRNKNKANTFYASFFKIQKLSGLKIRLFGKVSIPSIVKLSTYTPKILEIFSKRRTFFGELQFKFLENDQVIKLETNYLSKDSLQLFYEENAGEVSDQLKILVAEIEEACGEVIFSTRIDGEGNITGSSMAFYLPR